jgi:zinc transport system substrate-binding protein
MMRWLVAPVVVGSVLAGAALCVASPAAAGGRGGGGGRIDVVAAFYPLAKAVRQVGGDRVDVHDLTPAGAEPHDLELDTDDVDAILDADLAVVLGEGFQPAVEDAADQRDGPTLRVLDHLDRGMHGDDPHVWLDPARYREVVDAVADALADADPDRARAYRRNAARFDAELRTLDADFAAGLAECRTRTVLTAHDAFGWLARRYDLEQHGVAGLEPDAEPDPDRLADLADLAEREGVTTVFTEALVSPRVARTLAREAGGLRTAVLDPLEGLDDERIEAGDDYVSVMRDNLAQLRKALGCT